MIGEKIKDISDRTLKRNSFLYATGFPKITLIFFVLLCIVVFNALINYYYISKDRDNIRKITELISPYIEELDQLNEMIIESKMYATNWVHVPNYNEDKLKLDSIHKIAYPRLKSELIKKTDLLRSNYSELLKSNQLGGIFRDVDSLVLLQNSVMKLLADFDDYENPSKKFKAEDIIESSIFPSTQHILSHLRKISTEIKITSGELKQSILTDSGRITNIMIVLSFALVFFIAFSIYIIVVNIRRPSIQMKQIIDRLSRGELADARIDASDNIIGEMALSLNKLSDSFKKTALFAKEIESGNLNVSYEKLSERDHLGEALISMRDSLHAYADEMELKIRDRTEEVVVKGKQIELQKLFYESILSSIPLDIAIYDEDRKYVYVNEVAVHDAETRNYLIGKSDAEYCAYRNISMDFAKKREHYFDLARQNNTTTEFEDEIIDYNGNICWKIRRFTPVFETRHFRYMIAYGMDITGKKEQEIQVKKSLEEKESLLGEIHHRVKNNLTLVLGLIEMQRDRQSDEILKGQFNEIKNRIYAMSLIHDKMYKSHSFANIELNDYLKDLVTSISRFYGKGRAVALQFELEKVSVKGKDAIPIALLMNEVVTNSFKYAFNTYMDELGGGVLSVSLKKDTTVEGGLILTIKDNGPGIPEGMDVVKSPSLGFKLIHIFVKQLKGELIFFNEGGLNFVIKFKF